MSHMLSALKQAFAPAKLKEEYISLWSFHGLADRTFFLKWNVLLNGTALLAVITPFVFIKLPMQMPIWSHVPIVIVILVLLFFLMVPWYALIVQRLRDIGISWKAIVGVFIAYLLYIFLDGGAHQTAFLGAVWQIISLGALAFLFLWPSKK